MANRRVPHSEADFPSWARTAGAARAEGIYIQISCQTCGVTRPVDLDRVIEAKGEGYSLLNHRHPCRLTPGCLGRIRLRYKGHGCMRLLETQPFVDWWIEREWHARQKLAEAVRRNGLEREAKKARERR